MKILQRLTHMGSKKVLTRYLRLALLTSTLALLSGCASNSLTAPCPNYGKHCSKTPINVWDVNQ